MKTSLFAAGLFASSVSAHFSVTFPWWRGDSYATQWTYPCGGVDTTAASEANRTLWPLDGGAIAFKPTHDWAQTYINMGLGGNVTRFNITLAPPFNQTSNGTFCFPKVTLPDTVSPKEGDKATIQVIQLSTSGGALYNCADIEFSEKATDPPKDVCFNSTGVGAEPLDYDGDESDDASGSTPAGSSPSDAAGGSSAGSIVNPSTAMSMLFGAIVVAGFMA